MTPGCSAISPPMRAAPTWRHPSATPATSSAIWDGSTIPRRDVVEEEQRLGPLAHQIVDAHGHQIDPDGVEPPELLGHQCLGAHAVGPGHQDRLAVAVGVQGEQPAEVAEPAEHLGTEGGGHQGLDQIDGTLTGLDVHAGAGIGRRRLLRRERPSLRTAGHLGKGSGANRPRSPLGPAGHPAECGPVRELDGHRHRVVAGQAGVAEAGPGGVDGGDQMVEGQVLE